MKFMQLKLEQLFQKISLKDYWYPFVLLGRERNCESVVFNKRKKKQTNSVLNSYQTCILGNLLVPLFT